MLRCRGLEERAICGNNREGTACVSDSVMQPRGKACEAFCRRATAVDSRWRATVRFEDPKDIAALPVKVGPPGAATHDSEHHQ